MRFTRSPFSQSPRDGHDDDVRDAHRSPPPPPDGSSPSPDDNDNRHDPHDAAPSKGSSPPPVLCPPYRQGMLERQLAFDTALRWGIVVAIAVLVAAAALVSGSASMVVNLLILAAAGAWIFISAVSARVWQQLPRIGALLDHDPAQAEAQLAVALGKRPLHRSVRLLLYHRLAVLRHRQQRFDEASAICHAVLARKLRNVGGVRAHLLLIFVECRLYCGDLGGAYHGLMQLHGTPLSLVEALQRMALQTRYELAAGYARQTLAQIQSKVRFAELMPAPQCGAMHAMLAVAARRAQQDKLAAWLQKRAELLCTPQQLELIIRTEGRAAPEPIAVPMSSG